MKTSRYLLTAAASAGLLAATACTSDDGTLEEPPGPPWTEVATEPAWELEGYTAFGPVQSAADVFVMYALDAEDEVVAIGVDAATGEVRWEHYATFSRTIAGVAFYPETEGDQALTMRVTDLEQRFEYPDIALVDVSTGNLEWTYPVGSVGTAPGFCGTEDELVCLIAWVRGSGDDAGYQYIVLDRATGDQLSTTPLDDSRLVSTGLFPAGEDDDELTHVDHEGAVAWQLPIRELFGSDELSPDYGWHIRLHDDGFYFGLLGAPPVSRGETSTEFDYSLHNMAAFDQTTGESIWIEEGVGRCGEISLTDEDPVWCRADGTLTYEGEDATYAGSTAIEGFDPATGEALWTWEHDELGDALYTDSDKIFQVTESLHLLRLSDGDHLLHLATGEVETTEEEVPLWCETRETVTPGRVIHDGDDAFRNNRFVSNGTPCDLDGEPLGEVVTTPDFAGETVGDHFAWIDGNHLKAVRILKDE